MREPSALCRTASQASLAPARPGDFGFWGRKGKTHRLELVHDPLPTGGLGIFWFKHGERTLRWALPVNVTFLSIYAPALEPWFVCRETYEMRAKVVQGLEEALKSELEALKTDQKALKSELEAFSEENQTSLA